MVMTAPRRAAYRVRQFAEAVIAHLAPLGSAGQDEAHALLPERAWALFDSMPRHDRRHSLQVLRILRARGYDEVPLLQAALLHDAAKAEGGVTLLHRVAVVLLKAFGSSWLDGWSQRVAPPRGDPRYGFWAHVNHPVRGAQMAAEAGCDPIAVVLIRRHQDLPAASSDPAIDRSLAALQAADDNS